MISRLKLHKIFWIVLLSLGYHGSALPMANTRAILKKPFDLTTAYHHLQAYPAIRQFSSSAQTGPIGRINLLKSQLSQIRPEYQNSSLVHGAIFSEFELLKSIYTLLVTPKRVTLEDGTERLVPDQSSNPLGTLLQQFFYLGGTTFAPTKRISSCTYRWTPVELGVLYQATIKQAITPDFNPLTKNISGTAKRSEYEKTRQQIMTSLLDCQNSPCSAIRSMYPSIIRAFFWKKFVMAAESCDQAQANIQLFNQACQETLSTPTTPDDSKVDLESRCIGELINRLGRNGLPNPPIQGHVTLKTKHTFPDCGESGIRAFFNAAFYNPQADSFQIPESKKSAYDQQLVKYYDQYPTLEAQSTQTARNAWGELLSNRPNLVYFRAQTFDLNCSFINIITALTDLAPGFNYLKNNSLKNAQENLNLLAQAHGLEIHDFKWTKSDCASWNLSVHGNQTVSLKYTTYSGHLSCDLISELSDSNQTSDPQLGCINQIWSRIENGDKYHPILLAGARMAKHQNYLDAYLALKANAQHFDLPTITNNIRAWGLMPPQYGIEVQKIISQPNKTLLSMAFDRGLYELAQQVLDHPDCVITPQEASYRLHYAIRSGKLSLLQGLIKLGANPKQRNLIGFPPLLEAAFFEELEMVKYLAQFDYSLEDKLDTLTAASINAHFEMAKYLFDNCLPASEHQLGATNALNALAKQLYYDLKNHPAHQGLSAKQRQVLQLLLSKNPNLNYRHEQTNRTALEFAELSGNLELHQLLLDHQPITAS